MYLLKNVWTAMQRDDFQQTYVASNLTKKTEIVRTKEMIKRKGNEKRKKAPLHD